MNEDKLVEIFTCGSFLFVISLEKQRNELSMLGQVKK